MRPPLPLLLVLLCALTACRAGTSGGSSVASAAGAAVIPLDEREPAPDVRERTLDGEELALADLRGPVLVNFWASWCGPCAKEAPHLEAVRAAYTERGLHVVGVNVKDRLANARSFERDFGVTYPSWYDEAASIAAAFGGIGPAALPSTLLLDREHRVAVRLFGAVTGARLAPYLDALLEEGAEAA